MASTTEQPAATPAVAQPLTIADKLSMSLDDLTKLNKKEATKKRNEERKKKRAEQQEKKKKEEKMKEQKPGAETPGKQQKQGQKQQQKSAEKKGNAGTATNKAASGSTPAKTAPKQQKQLQTSTTSEKPPIVTGTPVIVSNLNEPLEQDVMMEVFGAAGPIKSAEMLRFNGKKYAAKIIYKLKSDAEKAIKEFNGRLLDGEPMKVSLARKRENASASKPEEQTPSQPNKRQRKSAA